MRKSLLIPVSLFAIFSAVMVSAVVARTWSDMSGRFSVEAEFIGFSDGKVQLKTKDGREIAVPASKLSKADQQWVREELRRQSESRVSSTLVAQAKNPTTNTTVTTSATGWQEWRGPKRDGVSKETGLLDKWTDDGPPLLWSARGTGGGYSSVSIADGRIFTMGKKGGQTMLVCLSEKDGSMIWETPAGGGGAPNCTPTFDPESNLVYGLTHGGDLLCADAKSGREVWRKNFGRDFGGKMMSGWGYSESPLVDGDRLICTPGSDRAVMAALNKRTGEVVWTTQQGGSGGAGYASPIISKGGGVKQYITLVRRGLIGVSADDGSFLWNYERIANGTANIPTSIVKDDFVFCSTGYGDGGSALLQLKRQGNGVGFNEVYYKNNNELQNHHGGMVLIGDHIFMGHGHNNGLAVCLEMRTGKIVWGPQRGPGSNSAAIIAADGDLYFRYENGTMALIEANPRQYVEKGSFRIATVNGKSWAHPVIADKKLYLRDQDNLHCYNIAAR